MLFEVLFDGKVRAYTIIILLITLKIPINPTVLSIWKTMARWN